MKNFNVILRLWMKGQQGNKTQSCQLVEPQASIFSQI